MKILADVEERRSPVPDCLRRLGVVVELTRLPVADYVLAPRVAVERTTVSDLHRGLATGRLWSQVGALRHELDIAYVVVEGRDLDEARGALLHVLDNGIRVIRTAGPRDTALWLRLMAARSSTAAEGLTVRRRGRRRMVVSPAGVLATIPGISPCWPAVSSNASVLWPELR